MLSLLSAVGGYGGYISPVKLAVVVLLYFGWIPLVKWVYEDAQQVQANYQRWTIIMVAAGEVGLLVWLFAPMFPIGLLVYLIAVGATAVAYTVHRNSRVADFEKVLTAKHLKGFFINEKKRMEKASRGLTLTTANGNDAPLPEPKSPDAMGFSLVCEIFEDAAWRRAGDIIFQPGQQEYSVTYFIDGIAAKQPPRSREDMEYFVRYLKHLADLDMEERRKPQMGCFKISWERGDQGRDETQWEVTTAGSTAGEQVKVSKRQEYGTMRVEDLGFTADQLKLIKSLRDIDKGLILLSGPPREGITTTLYAMLRNHDPYMNNINTLEKKLSADLQNITQHVYSLSDTGTTSYARKLQSAFRMGPDIMGISDSEDKQCAHLACVAVRDGVIVYAAMEATSVVQALDKWMKLEPDKNLLVDSLAAILNQRLVRVLCDECKQAYQPNQELFRKFNIPADKIKVLYRPGEIEYGKHGKPLLCEKCQGTGFCGRTAIFETIILNDKLREAIKKAGTLKEIGVCLRKAGMFYLQEQSIRKVAQGVTSINEVIRHFSAKKAGTQKS